MYAGEDFNLFGDDGDYDDYQIGVRGFRTLHKPFGYNEAFVDVVHAPPQARRLLGRDQDRFRTRIFISQELHNTMDALFFLPVEGGITKLGPIQNVKEVKREKEGMNRMSVLHGFHSDQEAWLFVIEFKSEYKFEHFFKIFKSIQKNNRKEETPASSEVKPRKIDCHYKLNHIPGTTTTGIGLSQSCSTSVGLSEVQFYEKDAEGWTGRDYRNLSEFLFLQKEAKGKVFSLEQYIISTYGEELFEKNFIGYFEEHHGNYITLNRDIKRHGGKPSPKVSSSQRERSLEPFYNDKKLCHLLKTESDKLKRDHLFDMKTSLILKKLVDSEAQITNIEDVKRQIVGGNYKQFWDVEDCTYVLLNLLINYQKEEEWIETYKQEFLKLEKEKFGEKYDFDVVHDIVSESNLFDFDCTEWEEMLFEFNQKKKIDLEKVSFEIYIQKKQILLRRELLFGLSNPDIKDLEKRLRSINEFVKEKKVSLKDEESELERITKKCEELELKLNSGEDDSPDQEKDNRTLNEMLEKRDRLSDMLSFTKNELNSHEQELKDIKMKMNQILDEDEDEGEGEEEEKPSTKRKKEEIRSKIEEMTDEYLFGDNNMKLRQDFGERRRRHIYSHLRIRFSEIMRNPQVGGIYHFGVRFEVSVAMKKKNNQQQQLIQHFRVYLGNVCIDWTTDSLVHISLGRPAVSHQDERMLLLLEDCKCGFLLDEKSLIPKLTRLAETIVETNLTYRFGSDGDHLSSSSLLSSNAFCFKVLECLNYTRFEIPILTYLEGLKMEISRLNKQVRKMKGKNEEDNNNNIYSNLMFLSMSKEFTKEVFESLNKHHNNNNKSFLADKKNRVYFRSHQELDGFLFKLFEFGESADIKFSGEFELLKGFDFSFCVSEKRMEKVRRREEEGYECPFYSSNDSRERRRFVSIFL